MRSSTRSRAAHPSASAICVRVLYGERGHGLGICGGPMAVVPIDPIAPPLRRRPVCPRHSALSYFPPFLRVNPRQPRTLCTAPTVTISSAPTSRVGTRVAVHHRRSLQPPILQAALASSVTTRGAGPPCPGGPGKTPALAQLGFCLAIILIT